jgi:formylglycine-generating enzyme required for sulfatase activity
MRRLLVVGVTVAVALAGCRGDGRPTAPPPTGSCCALDGACTVTMETICTGTWTASGTCTPNPCPQLPTGMVLIPAGTFTMGSPTSELWREADETQHQVTLTRSMYVSTCEVTQSEWQAVMGWNESSFPGAQKPVEQVTWFDAVSYCNQRSIRDGKTPAYTITDEMALGRHIISAAVRWNPAAIGYRLLTEAEWEYACRATSTLAFCNGAIEIRYCLPVDSNLGRVGWYCGNTSPGSTYSGSTHAVGGKAANAWGLKDMHGNVWEWCWDWYGPLSGNATDPTGPTSGALRVRRGGGWFNYASDCRSASRLYYLPDGRSEHLGFRLAMNAP